MTKLEKVATQTEIRHTCPRETAISLKTGLPDRLLEARMRIAYFVGLALFVAACGDDPLSHSGPVAINLKAKSADTTGGTVTSHKNINTETGNPFAAFIRNSENALGKSPGRIEVVSVNVLLGAGSTGVTTLGEIFTGTVRVDFKINSNTYPVASASLTAATGAGPIAFPVNFDCASLAPADWTKMLGSDFEVYITGPAAASFQSKGADANLQVTFNFASYE